VGVFPNKEIKKEKLQSFKQCDDGRTREKEQVANDDILYPKSFEVEGLQFRKLISGILMQSNAL
jgi:hypothetical protein